MIESILRKSGLRSVLFASPHVSRLDERFVVDREAVSDALHIRAWNRVEPAALGADAGFRGRGRTALTYFDVLTVIGFSVCTEGKGARLLIQASDFEVEADRPTAAGLLLSIRTLAGLHDGLEPGLRRADQSQNAVVAAAAVTTASRMS